MSFTDSILARTLRRLADAICQYPKWFVYPQIILSVLCLLYAIHGLKVDFNRDNLVGQGAKYHQIYLKFRREFPEDDQLVLVESTDPERNRRFVEHLAARLQPQTNLFSDVFYKGDPSTLGPKALQLAPTADLVHMRESVGEYAPFLRDFTQATNLNSLFSLVNERFRTGRHAGSERNKSLMNALPFLERIVTDANQSLSEPGQPTPPEVGSLFGGGTNAGQKVYLTFEQGRIFLLTVQIRNKALDSKAIEQLRQAIQQTQVELPGINVGLTGGAVLNYDEMRQSERDSIIAAVVALILCSLIFIIAYREVGRPLKTALCLFIGFGYTLGFATLAVGHLNILSITFAPMLVGLGIDFGVHLISRYEEETRHQRPVPEAIHKAMVFTGQGIVVGGFTTAAAFLAMGLTGFRGIREVGIICGGGLLLCLLPMMTTLPALLMGGRQNERDYQAGPPGQTRLQVEQIWLQHPLLVIVATLLLCVAALWQVGRVYFDYDLLRLQSPNLPSVRFEQKLIHSAGRSVMFAAVTADSPQQAREYEAKIKTLPSVSSVDSIALQLTEDPQRKLEEIRGVKRELAGIHFAPRDRSPVRREELSATLWYLSGYLGAASEATQKEDPKLAGQMREFRGRIGEFRKTLLSGQPQIPRQLDQYQDALFKKLNNTVEALQTQDTSGPLRPQDLPEVLRSRFIGITGKFLLRVYPRKDIWQHANQREFIQQLETAVPPDRVTGQPIQIYENTTLVKRSYEQAAWYSLIAIALMLFIHFRSPGSVILALLPVGIGSLWLLGLMGALGIPFNPANIMTLPLVVGIGVTNGIQILNRFAEEQRPAIFAKSTGKAVLVSGLTALTGFATLLLAKHQGIKSLGEVMPVGIAACMIAALVFLPALLSLLMQRPRAIHFLKERVHFGPAWHRLRWHRL